MRSNGRSRLLQAIQLAGDFALLNTAFLIAYYFKIGDLHFGKLEGIPDGAYTSLWATLNIAWLISALVFEIYELSRVSDYIVTITAVAKTLVLHVFLITAFIVIRKSYYYSREVLLNTYVLGALGLVFWRSSLVFVLREYRRLGFNFRRVVLVGYGDLSRTMEDFFEQHREYGFKFMGIFDDKAPRSNEVLGTVEDVKDYALANKVDEIYCSLPYMTNAQVNDLIEFADNNLIKVKILPDFRGFALKNLHIDFYDNLPVFSVRHHPLENTLNRGVKRVFDLGFSVFFIVFVSSWLFPLLALLIKVSSPGPVFFRQRRSGRDNREFWCLKFRTMRVNNDSDLKQATRNDNRITPIGRFLRKTNLDELPQFLNVLQGDMSVVGPRPHMLKHTEQYSQVIDGYMIRHLVKPGITGLAQAKGYRGETPTVQYMRNRVKMDRFYVDNWSLWLDVKIIVMTVLAMLRGDKNAI